MRIHLSINAPKNPLPFDHQHLLVGTLDHTQNLNIISFDESIGKINSALKSVQRSNSLNELRGYEGEGAIAYFSVFDQMILHQKEHFYFHERSRRPPLDNVNAMLSFVYTLLMHEITEVTIKSHPVRVRGLKLIGKKISYD